jgi:hypothetical protein
MIYQRVDRCLLPSSADSYFCIYTKNHLVSARFDFYSLDAQRSYGANAAQAIAYSRGAAEHLIISYLPDRFLLTVRAIPSEL